MKLNIIFPIKTHLHIFQLEEYKPLRFLNWYRNNLFKRKLEQKRELVYTNKVKLILALAFIWWLTILGVFVFSSPLAGIVVSLLLASQPYLLFFMAIATLWPYEYLNKLRIKQKTRKKINNLPNLKVIGITGSYAKTSVKEILYQILSTKYKTLRTPESYNTWLGVAKVVDYELEHRYEMFICEMGAYKKGEISEICDMVKPDYGILTGITYQHLARFGSLKNIVSAKFELVEAVNNLKRIVFNLENKNINAEIKKRNYKVSKPKIKLVSLKLTKNGMLLKIVIDKNTYSITANLFGEAQAQNICLASEMALKLGMKPKEVIKALNNLKPFSNRFIVKKLGNTRIVDNTYSSNLESFKQTIKTAKSISGRKVLITPGIVELGNKESSVHKKLGALAKDSFDQIVLVGKSRRTEALKQASGKKSIFISDNKQDYQKYIQKYVDEKYDWIFLENDLTDNY